MQVEKERVAAVKRHVALVDLLHSRTPAQHLLRHNEIQAALKIGRKGILESVLAIKDKDGRVVDDRNVDHLGLYYFAECEASDLQDKTSTAWSKYLPSYSKKAKKANKNSRQTNGESPAPAGAKSEG